MAVGCVAQDRRWHGGCPCASQIGALHHRPVVFHPYMSVILLPSKKTRIYSLARPSSPTTVTRAVS
ncbi:hypothetical protein M378DRAFT_541130 [Amanita muscaria Koide BX008]|uniref:Uncharacterized protein n=1 Tax=Amanita muscaria (strain Koide BX008) TaxID=946122 RepID=A0A0C2W4L9_AMAMK|nr:hypothetical protein M378DRAFT_541130 [Amanita muscaria Koide BX008]